MKKFIGDVRKYSYFTLYSAKTDLKAEVANSYLNWVWWILEPFFNMLVYYFVFNSSMGGQQYFIISIYSALLMWSFINKTIQYSVKLVRSNREIVTKIYIPKFMLLISNMILNFVKLIISWSILIILMLIYRVPLSGKMLMVIPVYIVMFVFTFGIGTIFLHFGVFVDDLAYAVSILLNMLFFLSGVFYDCEMIYEAPMGILMKTYNPIAFLIDAMRKALLFDTMPNLGLLGIWLLVSVTLSVIGVKIIYKYENTYVKIV